MQATRGMPRALAALFACGAGMAVATVYCTQPLLNLMADEFGIAHAHAGLFFAVAQLGYAAGLVLVVPLSDAFDRRRMVIGQSLLLAAALLAVGLAGSRAALLAALALLGLASSVTQVLVAYAAALAPAHERGRTLGTVTGGIVVGIVLARVLSASVAGALGWRSVYLLTALGVLAISCVYAKALPAHPRQAGLRVRHLAASTLRLFASVPVLRTRALLAMLIFAVITTVLTPLMLMLTRAPWSLSPGEVGLFGLSGLAGAAGAAVGGRWVDRGRAQQASGAALVLMFAAWLPLSQLSVSLWPLVLGILLLDFGLQAVHVSNQALVYRERPEAQSRLAAAYMVFYCIGCAAGSMASTLAYASHGWPGVCAVGAGLSMAALAFWAWSRPAAIAAAA